MATAFVPTDPSAPTDPSGSAPAEPASGGASAPLAADRADTSPAPAKDASPAWTVRVRALVRQLAPPVAGILAFLMLWAVLAPQVKTSLGALPGPVAVLDQGVSLYEEWRGVRSERAQFYLEQDRRNAAAIAAGSPASVQNFDFTGPPTFPDQVMTSLKTVALGFILATLIAVPIGLICGLSPLVNAAINPLVQIMKPVSPLAWLPIVTMVVSAAVTSADPWLAKSFLISAIVVMLCSLWPTLINTAVGTASIDKDLINVGRVLRLGLFARLTRLILPATLPYIFTGMRLSLGVGWMVLIAAEMLAQNPGLGKFVWDEFQNGSSQSLARIMFAVIIIGLIGFGLDRLMMGLQKLASRNHTI